MRNYIDELKQLGYTTAAIAKETGYSKSTIQNLATGKARLSSGTAKYETIRNTSRRLAYRLARQTVTPAEASALRRRLPNPEADIPMREKVTKQKALFEGVLHVLWIRALFRNTETEELRIEDGESTAYKSIEYDEMLNEAIENARNKLPQPYKWELVRILDTEMRIIELKGE
jgi:transcriptional regulator with XRE-family HTH domain